MAVDEFLTPSRPGDVFVTVGSGEKLHVIARAHVEAAAGRFMVLTCCGRRGRKIRLQAQFGTPPNTSRHYAVCVDCREFCRAVNI